MRGLLGAMDGGFTKSRPQPNRPIFPLRSRTMAPQKAIKMLNVEGFSSLILCNKIQGIQHISIFPSDCIKKKVWSRLGCHDVDFRWSDSTQPNILGWYQGPFSTAFILGYTMSRRDKFVFYLSTSHIPYIK